MFRFDREQKILKIAGVEIGGQPGQFPTVLVESIFYHGHEILEDEESGGFDRERAEELLAREGELSREAGNPRIVDLCSSRPRTFEKF